MKDAYDAWDMPGEEGSFETLLGVHYLNRKAEVKRRRWNLAKRSAVFQEEIN